MQKWKKMKMKKWEEMEDEEVEGEEKVPVAKGYNNLETQYSLNDWSWLDWGNNE